MRKKIFSVFIITSFTLATVLQSCEKNQPPVTEESKPTPVSLNVPGGWPKPNFDPQNPLTAEGVELGRYLFYDKILSGNQTQSCGSCHSSQFAFTDGGKRYSEGSAGDIGTRNSMPLYNLNWHSGYFWEGRQATIESLIKEPMEAHNEMNLNIDSAVARLKKHPEYPARFKKAFPGQEINATALRFAIAQFIRTIISSGTKWDQYFEADPRNPQNMMTPAQKRGYLAFIDENRGDCFHCHSPINPLFISMVDRQFTNNGLDSDPEDGRMKVTGNPNDKGKFKTPSLRNVMLTAPYMHDGRFATIEEVLDHYDHGVKYSATVDPMLVKHLDPNTLQPIPRMSAQDKADIIEFLKLLTDDKLAANPAYQSPF